MSFESQALFFQTDLTEWNTSIPVECVSKCLEPPQDNFRYNIFRKYYFTDKLIKQFYRKKSNKYPWKIELSPDGLFIIILKNNNLELKSSKLDFSNVNFQCQIYRDLYPQWRCVAWSNLSNFFGVTFSNGMCNIWDVHGSRLAFKYCKINNFDPVNKLVLVNLTKNKLQIYILTLKGKIIVYSVHNLKIVKSQESTISFLKSPILCAEVSFAGNLIVLGTYGQYNQKSAFKNGIISCRLIDEEPFIVSNVDNDPVCGRKSWFSNLLFNKASDAVYVIKISKDNKKLIALHLSNYISIWTFPSLNFVRKWNPSHNLTNSLLTNEFIQQRIMPIQFSGSFIIDICWWNNEYIVVALQNGRIIILNPDQSENENISLYPLPQIHEGLDKSFFALNCITQSKDTDITNDSQSVVENSSWSILKSLFHVVGYFFIDNSSDGFLSRKNLEMCSLNLQLTRFQLTTPDELFQIQIDTKQYSQALELARKYQLDVDVVFQKQWRDSNKTIDDIKRILTKIGKRNWILNECLKRIPHDIDSLKYLLKLGLQLTNMDHLHSEDDDVINIAEIANQRRQPINNDHIVNVIELNLVQLESIRIRIKLLSYWDKLSMYERILALNTKQSFRRQLFKDFKQLTPFELGISFANSGDIVSLRVLFECYQKLLWPHILTILSNIPECIDPASYRSLFDYLGIFQTTSSGGNAFYQTDHDWCELPPFDEIYEEIMLRGDVQDMYYQTNGHFSSLIIKSVDHCRSIFTKWIDMRVRNIEKSTLNAQFALDLLNIAKQLDITIDADLEFNLYFLCEAVYNCQISNGFISLDEFQSLSHVDKAKLIMSRTDPERFLNHFHRWIAPLSQQLHSRSPTQSLEFFSLYLSDLARRSMVSVRKLIEDKQLTDTIIDMIGLSQLITIYISILHQDDDPANLIECCTLSRLLRALISQKSQDDQFVLECNQLIDIERYISVLKIMSKYGVQKSLAFVHNSKDQPDLVENMMTTMVHRYVASVKSPTKLQIQSLVSELQTVLGLVFKSIHPKLVYRHMLTCLLESGDRALIQLACQFLDLKSTLSPITEDSIGCGDDQLLLDFNESCSCIARAAANYIDASTSSKHKNFLLAKYCLQLVRDQHKSIDVELDLVRCCEFLDKHRCPLVPIEVRSTSDRWQLLKNCLDANPNLYRQLEHIIEAASYLRPNSDVSIKYHEGETLRLLAQKAMVNKDWETLDIAMASLKHRNHQPCWEECLQCVEMTQFQSQHKLALAQYAVTHCPKSQLSRALQAIKQLEIASLTPPISLPSAIESVIDTNINSTDLIKQPIKLIASKLSLKSLIDKSSDTIVKLSNQMKQFNTTSSELYNHAQKPTIDRLVLNAFYQRHRDNSFPVDIESDLSAILSLLSSSSSPLDTDVIHSQMMRANLYRDMHLSIVHSILIDDLRLIDELRHDFQPNLFNRAFILSMIQWNLIVKYTHRQVPLNSIRKTGFQSIIVELKSQFTETESTILNSAQREFDDYHLLDKIKAFVRDACPVKFFSFADYRLDLIGRLCAIVDKVDAYRCALMVCDRYGINKRSVAWKYLLAFVTNNRMVSETEFQQHYNLFQSIFDWDHLFNDRIGLRNDLQSYLIGDSTDQMTDFQTVLNLLDRIDNGQFTLFNRTAQQHRQWMQSFQNIYAATDTCIYLDLFQASHKSRLIDALKRVINTDNLQLCHSLMNEFDLSNEFETMKTEFSAVLANKTLWSSTNQNSSFNHRFKDSLKNFSINDYNNCKDFVSGTLFDQSHSYINLDEKMAALKSSQSYIDEICNTSQSNDEIVNNWSKVNMEITIWLDHINNSVCPVVNQLKSTPNMTDEIVKIAEYLPPENYWDCLMKEMLLSGMSYQDFFTFTWEMNMESFIVEESIGDHISHIVLSKYIPTDAIVERLSQIFNELDEFLDAEPIINIIVVVLSFLTNETPAEVIHWLLNEFVFRNRQTKSMSTVDLTVHIFAIMSQWDLPINNKWEITNTNNLFIIDALIQDCDSVERMGIIGKVIELIELIHEDNNLWQCWVKSCIIKGAEFSRLVFDRFRHLKENRLYNNRLQKLLKDATQSLVVFNPSEAISLLILKDPMESLDQIQSILIQLKSDPVEYSNTMKNINSNALQIIVDQKLIPLYAKTILFQRLVNFITKEKDDPNLVQDILEQLKQKGLRDEATWLASSSSHINPAQKTIEMVSGFWKRFGGGSS